jgi:hypothetical protein
MAGFERQITDLICSGAADGSEVTVRASVPRAAVERLLSELDDRVAIRLKPGNRVGLRVGPVPILGEATLVSKVRLSDERWQVARLPLAWRAVVSLLTRVLDDRPGIRALSVERDERGERVLAIDARSILRGRLPCPEILDRLDGDISDIAITEQAVEFDLQVRLLP